jgi:hypothetical protein
MFEHWCGNKSKAESARKRKCTKQEFKRSRISLGMHIYMYSTKYGGEHIVLVPAETFMHHSTVK